LVINCSQPDAEEVSVTDVTGEIVPSPVLDQHTREAAMMDPTGVTEVRTGANRWDA